MLSRRNALLVLALLAGASMVSLMLALMVGSVGISLRDVLGVLTDSGGGSNGIAAEVVMGLRLPRALAGFACGGLLALAGAFISRPHWRPLWRWRRLARSVSSG